MLGTILEMIPVVGPVISVVGMVSDLVAPPSAEGSMTGLALTIAVFNWARPKINEMVEWTDTKRDDAVWNVITNIMGYVIKFARLDKDNVTK